MYRIIGWGSCVVTNTVFITSNTIHKDLIPCEKNRRIKFQIFPNAAKPPPISYILNLPLNKWIDFPPSLNFSFKHRIKFKSIKLSIRYFKMFSHKGPYLKGHVQSVLRQWRSKLFHRLPIPKTPDLNLNPTGCHLWQKWCLSLKPNKPFVNLMLYFFVRSS